MTSGIEVGIARMNFQDSLEQSMDPAHSPSPHPSPFYIPELLSHILLLCKDSNYSQTKVNYSRLSLVNRTFYHEALLHLYSEVEIVILQRVGERHVRCEVEPEQIRRATLLYRAFAGAPRLQLLVKSIRVSFVKPLPADEEGADLLLRLRKLPRLEKISFEGSYTNYWIDNQRGGGGQTDWVRLFCSTVTGLYSEALTVLCIPQLRLFSNETAKIFQHCSKLKVFRGNVDIERPRPIDSRGSIVQLERLFASIFLSHTALRCLLAPSTKSLRFLSFNIKVGDPPLLLEEFVNLESLVIQAHPERTPATAMRNPFSDMSVLLGGVSADGSDDLLSQVTKIIESTRTLPNLRLLAVLTSVNPYLLSVYLEAQFMFLPQALEHFLLGPNAYPDLPWMYLFSLQLNPNLKKISITPAQGPFFTSESVEEIYFGCSIEQIKKEFGIEVEWVVPAKLNDWIAEHFYSEDFGRNWKF